MELSPKTELFQKVLHPYTESLISASPIPSTNPRKKRIILQGEIPSSIDPPSGCRFHPRCHKRIAICTKIEPKLEEVEPGRFVRCHLYGTTGGA
jgi:oligopeptide/dipeptide ABC transporter ATP-binding protein